LLVSFSFRHAPFLLFRAVPKRFLHGVPQKRHTDWVKPDRKRHPRPVKPVEFSDPAAAEPSAAVRWYDQRRVGLGAELLDAIAATIDRAHSSRRRMIGAIASERHRSERKVEFRRRIIDRARRSGLWFRSRIELL